MVKVIILGCGRVGAALAHMMDRAGHHVTIIDLSSDAFRRLDPQFGGDTVIGNGVDEEVLLRAGIKAADVFVAVTNGDNRNIMASQIVKEIFKIEKVVCRIYDPIRQSTYNDLGLETICPTTVITTMLFDTLMGEVLNPKETQG